MDLEVNGEVRAPRFARVVHLAVGFRMLVWVRGLVEAGPRKPT